MRRALLGIGLGAAIAAAGCGDRAPVSKRAEIRAVGPASIQIIPAAGQMPFCLVYTFAENGIVRQLTPLDPNEAIPCPAGAPVGGATFKIPPREGKVRIYVVLADRALDGRGVAAQVREMGKKPGFSAMDLRAPGNVALEALEFEPR